MSRHSDGADIALKLAGVLLMAGVGIGLSHCSTENNIGKNPDGSCDVSKPGELKFKTYENCGDNCTRTIYHEFNLSSGRQKDGQDNITVHYRETRPTRRTTMEFDYIPGGITQDARMSVQTKSWGGWGKANAPQHYMNDVRLFDSPYFKSFGDPLKDGFQKAGSLLSTLESRASCQMPRPAKAGVLNVDFKPKSDW